MNTDSIRLIIKHWKGLLSLHELVFALYEQNIQLTVIPKIQVEEITGDLFLNVEYTSTLEAINSTGIFKFSARIPSKEISE